MKIVELKRMIREIIKEESVNEGTYKVDKILKVVNNLIKKGYLHPWQIDDDTIFAIASQYKIQLNANDVDKIFFELADMIESISELTKAQEKLPPALKKAIEKKEKNKSVNEAKTYKKGDKLKIKLKNGKKFDVVFDSYSRKKGVAFGKFKDGSGEYDTKPFNLDTIIESVNEAIGSLTILGTGVLAVFALLQMFIAYKRNYYPALTLKGADSIYSNLLKFWKPIDFVNTWKIVKRDTKILKIVNRLKDDPEVKKFIENPKQIGWYKMLSKKLDASEMDMLNKIYKRHFDKDGPNMDGSKWSHLESKYIKHVKSNESVNELDINDPIMMKLRAAQVKRNQMAAKKTDTEKQNKNAIKIKALKKKRAEVMRDMEQEAEPEGGKIANRYGDLLNKIDNDIIKLGGNPIGESVNEAIGSLAILGTGVLAVFALLQMFIAYKRNYHPALTLKGADSIYSNLLKFWKPIHFVNTWKKVKRDTKILKIVNRLKDDPEVKKFIENPKQTGWYKMLSKKLDASEMDMLNKIYKRHFDKDGPNMDGSKWSHLESINEGDVKKKINRRGDVDGLIVTHNGNDYEIVYSSDFTMSGAVQPYGIIMPGDDVVSFLGKDRKAKSIWKQLKPKVDKFVKSNESVNEDTKKRFDVDFYKDNGDRHTSHEEIIRGNKFSDIVSQATKVAKSKGMDYVEFYYKDLFIGSIDKRNGYQFKKGRNSQKSPLSVNEGIGTIALGVAGGLLLLKVLKFIVKKTLGAIGMNVKLPKEKLLEIVDGVTSASILKHSGDINPIQIIALKRFLTNEIESGNITNIKQIVQTLEKASK